MTAMGNANVRQAPARDLAPPEEHGYRSQKEPEQSRHDQDGPESLNPTNPRHRVQGGGQILGRPKEDRFRGSPYAAEFVSDEARHDDDKKGQGPGRKTLSCICL
jgi:hypothetical protein